ncbi:hypothetical protein T05_406 [Trichinella murrelli]|uniref:Uncharacterized protein n=1 Tax=Trichinella murrelli TaxID=144512 RepID=A0A0V0T328_9BILA|nr:hypothetical protein T05_14391 [Trichinella murrelli]KRX33899.1 hypothetical protein T05_406 [Trichinella murrelli]
MLVEDTSENGRSATELQHSIQHPLTNRWAIAIGRLTLTTQVAIVLPSPSCIPLAASCNFRPELDLSHTRLEITETIASLSSNNKIFKLHILSVTATTLPVSGLMVAIALLCTVRFQTRPFAAIAGLAQPGSSSLKATEPPNAA